MILRRCLIALKQTQYPSCEVMVVDNGSTDGSIPMVKSEFPDVQIVSSPVNLGFAGGCNLGIQTANSPYIVLLNNDAEVTPDWLTPLIEVAESDSKIASVQSKILSLDDHSLFDYSGAAGGEMDLFGYPFCWGRLFNTVEEDTGQYDSIRPIFWATGAVKLFRKSALDQVGLLDETFFAHMEEIDLDWRLHLAGYKVYYTPFSVVYHQTGGTLSAERLQKMVLNHRNNLMMILKNYQLGTLLWLFPLRLMLELFTFFTSPFLGNWKRSVAVVIGFFSLFRYRRHISKSRKEIREFRKCPDRNIIKQFYKGSIALAYYLKGIRSIQQLDQVTKYRLNEHA